MDTAPAPFDSDRRIVELLLSINFSLIQGQAAEAASISPLLWLEILDIGRRSMSEAS